MTLNFVGAVLSVMGFAPAFQEPQIPDLSILELKLEISTPRLALDPIDVLPITARWSNPSDKPIKTHQFVVTYLQSPKGDVMKSRRFHSGCDLRTRSSMELGPGQYQLGTTHVSPSILHRPDNDARAFLPPKAGEWKLWIEHPHRLGKLTSNVLLFTIKEDPTRSAESRRLFGSETWHRFLLGGGVDRESHTAFRRFVLSKEWAPQKDVMAYGLGLHDFNESRFGHALTMLGLADSGAGGNVGLQDLAHLILYCHSQLENDEECLSVIDRLKLDGRDAAFRRWIDLRKVIQERIDRRRASGR